MVQLYDELGKFNEDGTNLIIEAENVLKPLFEQYKEKGYNIREISHLIGFGLNAVENIEALKDMLNFLKKKNNDLSK
jgi:hypothetical protein